MKRYFLCLLAIVATVAQAAVALAQPPQAAEPKGLENAAQSFVELLAKGDFARAVGQFDETMTKVLPEEKLRAVWDSVGGTSGAMRRQLGTRTSRVASYDVVYVACEFEKSLLDVKVVFGKTGRISGLFFLTPRPLGSAQTPAYVKPAAFVERDVTVGAWPWRLPGTLTLPAGPGRFPAVVLVHGSGPNDRDETVGPNKPFRDLAWGLACQGIAVVRYEKRTKEHALLTAATLGHLTVNEETIDDCLAAVALLRKREEVNPKRVFVLGHSLGGMLIPRIGARDRDLAGLVAMAGINRPLEDVIVDQMQYIAGLEGADAAAKQALETVRGDVAKIKTLKPADASSAAAFQLLLGAPPSYWLDLRGYVPALAAKQLPQPLLVLQGERDYQSTMADFEVWQKTLAAQPRATLKSYPKLNHLFIAGEGQITPAEYERPGFVAAEVVQDIAEWIKRAK